jgi:RNA polymerase sigma factor (sigma-70 family)
MAGSDSISIWLREVKKGDAESARRLWERYFPKLVRLAQKKLAYLPRRMEDEEDVALSALDSFCRAADRGRFPQVNDRESLWRLLCRITHRKAVDLIRRSQRGMGDARVRGGFCLVGSSTTSSREPMAPMAPLETAGDFAAIVAEEVRRLLTMLPDDELRAIALFKMDGHTNQEIAREMGCAERTIERRLKYLRVIWRNEYRANK